MKTPKKNSFDFATKTQPTDSADLTENTSPLVGLALCVIGGGFVGLVTSAGFAEFGHSVVCVENDPALLEKLQSGKVSFYERELDELIARNVKRDRLSFCAELKPSIKGAKAIFITVGTPSGKDGRTDLSALNKVIKSLAENLNPNQVVVIKSTSPVGTARKVKERISLLRKNRDSIAVISNPEFLREGAAVYDFFHPKRIVIGGDNQDATELVSNIHRLGMKQNVSIVVTSNETAEMIKYASNVFLATKIGFVNELAELCDKIGVNALEVARGMGLDPRIGSAFLNPGPGWGGSCLTKDISEYIGLADAHEVSVTIARAVREANVIQRMYTVSKARNILGDLKNKRIGALGLTFKANTSDLRNSPAIDIIRELQREGATILAHDPVANGDASHLLENVELCERAEGVAQDADLLIILTEWRQFKLLDWKKIGDMMKNRNILDTRNLISPEFLRGNGFTYVGIGVN